MKNHLNLSASTLALFAGTTLALGVGINTPVHANNLTLGTFEIAQTTTEQPAPEAPAVVEEPKVESVIETPPEPKAEAPKVEAEPVPEPEIPKEPEVKAEPVVKEPAEKAAEPVTEQAPEVKAEEPKVEPKPIAKPVPKPKINAEPKPEPVVQPKAVEDRPAKKKKKEPVAEETKTPDQPNPETPEVKETPVKKQTPEATPPTLEELEVEKQAEEEAKIPVVVSDDAAKPKTFIEEPIAEQIKKAGEQSVVVVPDNITDADRAKLAAAEKNRRKEKRKQRNLIIGAAAAGVAVGVLLPSLGGRVASDDGDRFVVERDGEYYIRKDESALFRDDGTDAYYEQLDGGRVRETITRPNGVQVVSLRDPGGYVLRRVKIYPNGDEVVLFDSRDDQRQSLIDYDRRLRPIELGISRDEYIVSARRANRRLFYDTFNAEPVEAVEQGYSLQAIRDNERLRNIVRRVDLDTVTFAIGSAIVRQSQVALLGDIAGAILDVLEENRSAVFMIEGHTDAVGSDLSNLTLSDRRAETVAKILVEAYGVAPENLVVQGYGEQYLKINTEGPSEANRRATIRNITPILSTGN